ncbi:MAG TPA: protein kinase [Ktedonobacteraceae bacterium]|jgi:serine/threonine protein kinase
MSTQPSKKLGKYELRELLGSGGMAEVWKAFDTQLQRFVAIKLLHTKLQADAGFTSRFQREAQVIASLHHPNIVQIHDFQVEQDSERESPIFYMVMAYIEGQTLADYIAGTSARGKIPTPVELVNLFTSIGLAVDYAHQKGMIHRDIKPANILLDQRNRAHNPMGEPILTDFGLAKLLGVTGVTLTGTQMGTPLYTSPEQARGYPGNERSDLYSLGVILYEMVTGVAPFRGDTPTAVLAQHLFATPNSPVLFNPNIPPALTMVILTALAKDANARFPRASAMIAAMAAALGVPVPQDSGQPMLPSDVHDMPTVIGSLNPPQLSSAPAAQISSAPISTAGLSALAPASQPGTGTGSQVPAPPTPFLWSINPPSSPGTLLATSWPPSAATATPAGQAPAILRTSGPVSTMPTGLPPTQVSPAGAAPVPQRKRGLSVLLVTLMLLALVGGGLGTYFTFFHRVAPLPASGGQVFFVSSGQFDPKSAQGIADELFFALHNLPAPQPGQAYYAWLLADKDPHSEAEPLQPPPQFTLPLKIGPLPFQNGSINYLYQGTATHDNLFSLASRLLITTESSAGGQRGPAAERSTWRYYAEIPQVPYGSNHLSALDHIRHLFYKETKVAVLGLPGGLDVWLFKNTEAVLERAVSARDDYSPTVNNAGLMRGLFRVMLEYLDGSPNISLDLPGIPLNPPPETRVGLLSVSPAQQQASDVSNNPPGYLDHFALHLNGVVQAPDATSQMRVLSTQMIEALNNTKGWLAQVRTYARQLVVMDDAQLAQASTLLLLDNMLQYATYAYVGQLDPRTDQVLPAALQVHYDVQKLAALALSANLPQGI